MTGLLALAPTNAAYAELVAMTRLTTETTDVPAPDSYTLLGSVLDDEGLPLPGASVKIKGTSQGITTDIDGRFQLKIEDDKQRTLVISYIGMAPQEVVATPGKPLRVQLVATPRELDELIVYGFQTISRERSAGSAVIINSESLGKVQASDLSSKLEGIVPGLTIYNNQMSIRGQSSFSVSSTPLLVLDGQPVTGISLDDLNPDIIENVTVLKDAAATSLYGVRASNGVIVVTTKQASKNSLNVNVSLGYYLNPIPSLDYQHYASTSDIIDLEQDILLTDPEYIKSPSGYFSTMVNKTNAAYMSQVDMLYYRMSKGELTQEQVNAGLNRLRRNDYRREYRDKLQKLSLTQDYTVSLSNGGERYKLFASARYQNMGQHDQGSSWYSKYNSRNRVSFYLKNDLNVTPWMLLTLGADIAIQNTSYSQSDGLSATATMPYDRLINNDGSLAYRYPYNQVLAEKVNNTEGLKFMGYNALEEARKNIQKGEDVYMKYFLQTNFDITKDLGLELKFQYEKRFINTELYNEEHSYMMRSLINEFASDDTNGTFKYNIPEGGRMYATSARYNYYNLRGQFNYRKDIADKHGISALLGGEIRQDKSRSFGSERFGYDDQKLTYSQMDWSTLSQKGVVGQLYTTPRRRAENLYVAEGMHRYISAYFNAGYTYDSRYAVNASVRVEQADLFGTDPKYRYRPLWSVGGSWNASNETWMKDVKWLNMLKLRCTYGITGNVDQSSSPYLLGVYINSLYSNSPITDIISPPNSSLRWEKTSTFNFGIDYRLLQRLSGNIDVYRRYSSDLLVNKSIDPSLGFNGVARANNGEMQNVGVELNVSYEWLKKRDFSFITTLSAAYNKNTIKKVDYEPTDAIDMMSSPASNYRVGDTFNSLYAYRYAGLTATGDPSVYDENGKIVSIDPVRDVRAVICAGQLTPKWNGALTLDFRWKNLGAYVKAVYYTGHSLRNDVVTLYDALHPLSDGAVSEDIANRWTPTHTNTEIPAMGLHETSGERNYHWKYADANVCSASFIKLRNIGLTYSIPNHLLSKIKVKSIILKAQVDNPCYWAANKHDIDPEAFNANYGSRTVAQMPSYTLGLNVKF